ncbi:MAG: hypothetical protein FJZ01_28530 [Candidatus Sericytochromatia bacterium]|nr:hypothetical protein [Candidatus Tanganyikabacteria bacterium]
MRSAPPGAAAPIGVLAAAPGIPPAATGTAPAAPGGPAAGPGTGALPAAPQLSPAAAAVYANLSRSQKASYDKLYQIVKSADSADLPALKATEGLDRLLADKTLLKGDRTILKILAEHAGRPLPPALSRQGLTPEGQMRNIVNMLAYPDSVSQGKSSNTCVVAALQSIAAADYPRTFAKMATELIWDGTYTRGKGVRIPLSTSELGKAGGAAMTTSELIQGSLREFAKGIPPVGADFGAGRYGARGQYGGGRYGAKAGYGAGAYSAPATGQVAEGGEPVPGGLTAYQAEKLYERVLGQSAVSVEVDDKNRENVWKNITRKLEKGRDVSVGVTGTDEAEKPVLHQVTLVRMEGDKVWVRDSGRGNAQPYDSAMVKASLLTAVLPGDLVNYKTFNVLSNPAMPIDADAVPEPLVDAGAGNDGADSGYSGFPFPDFYS